MKTKHSEHWIYAACQVGQSGTSGYQTYTRTDTVRHEEEEELAKVTSFVASTPDRPQLATFGWNPLDSKRFALWQSRQGGVDDLGRDTYISEAFLFDSPNSLGAAPYAFYESPFGIKGNHLVREDSLFRQPLADDEVRGSKVPDLLKHADEKELTISEANHTAVTDWLKKRIEESPRRAVVLINHVLGKKEAPPSAVLIVGANEETTPLDALAAFALLWEATSTQPKLRDQLSLCTLLSESNRTPFTVAGRPGNWGKPSPQLLARFTAMFGWDAKDASQKPISLYKELYEAVIDFFQRTFKDQANSLLQRANLERRDPRLEGYKLFKAPVSRATEPANMMEFREILSKGLLTAAWGEYPAHVAQAASGLSPFKHNSDDTKLSSEVLRELQQLLGDKTPANIKTALSAHDWADKLAKEEPWDESTVENWLKYCQSLNQSASFLEFSKWFVIRLKRESVGVLYLIMAAERLAIRWQDPSARWTANLALACEETPAIAGPLSHFIDKLPCERRNAIFRELRTQTAALKSLACALAKRMPLPELIDSLLVASASPNLDMLESHLILAELLSAVSDNQTMQSCLHHIVQQRNRRMLVDFWSESNAYGHRWHADLSRQMANHLGRDSTLGAVLSAPMSRLSQFISEIGISDVNALLSWKLPSGLRLYSIDAFCNALNIRGETLDTASAVELISATSPHHAPDGLLESLNRLKLADLLSIQHDLLKGRFCLGGTQSTVAALQAKYPRLVAVVAVGVVRFPGVVQMQREQTAWLERLAPSLAKLDKVDSNLLSQLYEGYCYNHFDEQNRSGLLRYLQGTGVTGFFGELLGEVKDFITGKTNDDGPEPPPVNQGVTRVKVAVPDNKAAPMDPLTQGQPTPAEPEPPAKEEPYAGTTQTYVEYAPPTSAPTDFEQQRAPEPEANPTTSADTPDRSVCHDTQFDAAQAAEDPASKEEAPPASSESDSGPPVTQQELPLNGEPPPQQTAEIVEQLATAPSAHQSVLESIKNSKPAVSPDVPDNNSKSIRAAMPEDSVSKVSHGQKSTDTTAARNTPLSTQTNQWKGSQPGKLKSKSLPAQKLKISPQSTQQANTPVSPDTIDSLSETKATQIEPIDTGIGDADNSSDQSSIPPKKSSSKKRTTIEGASNRPINWTKILPIAFTAFLCICALAAWRFRNRIPDCKSEPPVTVPEMKVPSTENVVSQKTSQPIEDASYWSTMIQNAKTLDDLNELETKIKVSSKLAPNKLADLNKYLQARQAELTPKKEPSPASDLTQKAIAIGPPAPQHASPPKEVVTSEKPTPSEAEIDSKVKAIQDLLRINSLVEAGTKIGELPQQDGRATILDLTSDYNSRLIEWNQAKPELESFAKKLDAAVKIGDATAVEEARKSIEPINRKFGPMVLSIRPDLTPDGLISKVAEAKTKSEAASKLLSNCETAMKAGQISIVIDNLKSLSTLEASLNEKQKATLTVLRGYQSIVIDIGTRLVNQGVSADTTRMDELIGEIKDSPATTVRLNWAKNVRAKLFSGDYAGALEAYRGLTVSQNDQLVFVESLDPGWDRLMISTKELISFHVGYQLTTCKDLPVTKDDNEWYAPKGSKASEVKNAVREFQSKMATHPATQNLTCNGRPWKDILNEASQDGQWSPMTLNAVLAAQHAFRLPANGCLSDELIQVMGIQNKTKKEDKK